MKKILLLVLPVVLLLAACTSNTETNAVPTSESGTGQTAQMVTMSPSPMSNSTMPAAKTVVDVAVGSQDHTTLVAAVTAAGLVETLQGSGPFTVFAPTNAAFSALPAGTVEGLLQPAKKADLTKILTYHVVPGNLGAKDLKEGLKLKTVQGQELTFTKSGDVWKINGSATITAADLTASNGVIHVIDSVLMPQ